MNYSTRYTLYTQGAPEELQACYSELQNCPGTCPRVIYEGPGWLCVEVRKSVTDRMEAWTIQNSCKHHSLTFTLVIWYSAWAKEYHYLRAKQGLGEYLTGRLEIPLPEGQLPETLHCGS